MESIKGKVAAIKDEYTIIINKGSENGVEEDMRFMIYEEGEEIIDPDTKNSLGKLEYLKAKVKVKYASDKFAWAETYQTYMVNSWNAINTALLGIGNKQERIKLPLEEMANEPNQMLNRFVKVGDPVRQIID
jgi:hypothetical protein